MNKSFAIHVTPQNIPAIVMLGMVVLKSDLTYLYDTQICNLEVFGEETYIVVSGNLLDNNVTVTDMTEKGFLTDWRWIAPQEHNNFTEVELKRPRS